MNYIYETFDITTLYGYINEIEGGYIKANYHPEDSNIVILNYTELATFEKRWNEYTMSARGLILDLTDVTNNGIIKVLARPFAKFPNYGTNEIEGYEDDIDWNEMETIMEKMDGSLGISYLFKGELRFATRGSFTSEQALKATEMWHSKYAKANDNYMTVLADLPLTLLVEIIYPENRVVVDYHGEEKLVLLAMMTNRHDYSYDSVLQTGDFLGLPVVPQYLFTLEDMMRLKKVMSANNEGWIVRFRNGKRLKIKGDEYMEVHRIMYGVSDKAKVQAWSENRFDDYIMRLPEEFRPELEQFKKDFDGILVIILNSLELLYQRYYIEGMTKKDYALKIMTDIPKEWTGFLFKMFGNGVPQEQAVKEYIYKNYAEYLEVIRWNN